MGAVEHFYLTVLSSIKKDASQVLDMENNLALQQQGQVKVDQLLQALQVLNLQDPLQPNRLDHPKSLQDKLRNLSHWFATYAEVNSVQLHLRFISLNVKRNGLTKKPRNQKLNEDRFLKLQKYSKRLKLEVQEKD